MTIFKHSDIHKAEQRFQEIHIQFIDAFASSWKAIEESGELRSPARIQKALMNGFTGDMKSLREFASALGSIISMLTNHPKEFPEDNDLVNAYRYYISALKSRQLFFDFLAEKIMEFEIEINKMIERRELKPEAISVCQIFKKAAGL